MDSRRFSAILFSTVLSFALSGAVEAQKSEVKGAAILAHSCGKIAIKHMGLVHAGKMEEAVKLSTKTMQDKWKALPANDRTMMSEMMKDMSQTEAQFTASITANGVLAVNGQAATLTIKTTTKDANGSSTETTTQKFRLDAGQCLVDG